MARVVPLRASASQSGSPWSAVCAVTKLTPWQCWRWVRDTPSAAAAAKAALTPLMMRTGTPASRRKAISSPARTDAGAGDAPRSGLEALQRGRQGLAHHAQEQRTHARVEAVGIVAADRDKADAGKRQQRAGLHLLARVPVQHGVLVAMQASAQRLAGGQRVAEGGQLRRVLRDHAQPF